MDFPSDPSPVWHPFTQHGSEPPPIRAVGTEGAYILAEGGRRILDLAASWWVVTHGHRHPAIVAAIKAAVDTMDQVIFAGFTHPYAEELARGLVRRAPPGLTRVFFSDSGSTAVEVALKMALGHFRHLGARRTRIVVLEHAYHGDTIGTMSVGARSVFNAPYEPLLFDVVRIPFPNGDGAATLAALEAACAGGDVAALLVEPLVLGAGGMLMYAPEVLAAMAAVARRHGALVLLDEIMTGWGRTGTLFACEQAGLAPDILCTSKGLTGGVVPLAATLATEAIFASHYSDDRARTFFHSSSFTANPVACAAALANLKLWDEEPVAARVAALCAMQEQRLARFRGDPRFVNVRRCGTIAALDLAGSAGYLAGVGPQLKAFFLERDLLIRPLGNIIYLMPPYCVTGDELDRAYAAIDAAADVVGRG
ncbi:adenosylmethionine--8-amino-7-oxononanoate transaminase [Methylobrevis albus]|uniref:Adenosylmethionine-8-amino-7-oxononanoate aminotransferase n=1 Tax=Methylobrevis albus TaxID=2793297 RepID=A0A931I433_9HYPH|nr:adenosylmethionine--8-amino-7-oxononanoate transaminase [Methylobrevis albus]MBH0238498.1 adenosylmethionine--8-amino-7-oxononanoate transaminase [Methylobrevis albus]